MFSDFQAWFINHITWTQPWQSSACRWRSELWYLCLVFKRLKTNSKLWNNRNRQNRWCRDEWLQPRPFGNNRYQLVTWWHIDCSWLWKKSCVTWYAKNSINICWKFGHLITVRYLLRRCILSSRNTKELFHFSEKSQYQRLGTEIFKFNTWAKTWIKPYLARKTT